MMSSTPKIIAGGRAKLAIFLICLIGGIELTLASRSCKRTVMEIVKQQCGKAELRFRRDQGSLKGPERRVFQAQLGPVIANAIVQTLSGYFSKLLMSLGTSLASTVGSPLSAVTSLLAGRRRRSFSPYEGNSLPAWMYNDLGSELTVREVEELYNEIFEGPYRQPFTTPDKAKAMFLDIAGKCCWNEARCLREKIIECP